MNRHVINNEIRNLVLTTGNFHSDFLEDFVSRIDKKIKLILSQFHSYIKEAIAKSSREIYEFNFNAGIVAHEEGFETIRKIVEKILDIRLQVEKNSGNYGYNTICETIFANHPVFYYQYKALWSPNNIYFYSNAPIPYLMDTDSNKTYTPQPTQELQILWRAALDQKETDLIFSVEGHLIHAHKSILSIKVPYLSNLLNSGMKESKSQFIEIQEDSHEAFKAFLEFVYTGQIEENLKENINLCCELIGLANKYQYLNLRSFSIDTLTEWLLANLSTSNEDNDLEANFHAILSMASVYQIEQVVEICLAYVEKEEMGKALFISLLSPDYAKQIDLAYIRKIAKTQNFKTIESLILDSIFQNKLLK